MGGLNGNNCSGVIKRRDSKQKKSKSVGDLISNRMKTLTLLLCLIAVSSATKTCGENEELVGCHNTCEPQCGYTPKACTEQCIMNSCDCKDGFVRNSHGKCVEVFQCTKETTKCPENETFKGCGTACEPTCENPDPKVCTKQCLVNVCQCSKGFVRHGFRCIAKGECPK